MDRTTRCKLMEQALQLALLDAEINGAYVNAPYTIGGIYKARIRQHSDGNDKSYPVLELYQPEMHLDSYHLPEIKPQPAVDLSDE